MATELKSVRQRLVYPELQTVALELARLVAELEKAEGDKKATTEGYKNQIDELKKRIKCAAEQINDGIRDAGFYLSSQLSRISL